MPRLKVFQGVKGDGTALFGCLGVIDSLALIDAVQRHYDCVIGKVEQEWVIDTDGNPSCVCVFSEKLFDSMTPFTSVYLRGDFSGEVKEAWERNVKIRDLGELEYLEIP